MSGWSPGFTPNYGGGGGGGFTFGVDSAGATTAASPFAFGGTVVAADDDDENNDSSIVSEYTDETNATAATPDRSSRALSASETPSPQVSLQEAVSPAAAVFGFGGSAPAGFPAAAFSFGGGAAASSSALEPAFGASPIASVGDRSEANVSGFFSPNGAGGSPAPAPPGSRSDESSSPTTRTLFVPAPADDAEGITVDLTVNPRPTKTPTMALVDKLLTERFVESTLHTVREVKVSGLAWGPGAVERLLRYLTRLPALRELDASDIIQGLKTPDALLALQMLSDGVVESGAAARLTSLNLSSNALGPRGIVSCASLLAACGRSGRLESMWFCDNGLSARACELIAEHFAPAGCPPTTLRTLHYFNNMSGSEGAIATATLVRASPRLTSFRWSSTRTMEEGGAVLGAALAHCPSLTHLDLGDNTFKSDGALHLARSLADPRRASHTLRHLSVQDLSLGPLGCRMVLLALAHSGIGSALEHLDISCNEMGCDGIATLVSTLPTLPRLQYLSLELCEIDNHGVRALGAALREDETLAPALASIDLKENELSDSGALCFGHDVADRVAEGALRHVDLGGNVEVTPRAASELSAFLGDAFVPFEADGDDDAEEEEEEEAPGPSDVTDEFLMRKVLGSDAERAALVAQSRALQPAPILVAAAIAPAAVAPAAVQPSSWAAPASSPPAFGSSAGAAAAVASTDNASTSFAVVAALEAEMARLGAQNAALQAEVAELRAFKARVLAAVRV